MLLSLLQIAIIFSVTMTLFILGYLPIPYYLEELFNVNSQYYLGYIYDSLLTYLYYPIGVQATYFTKLGDTVMDVIPTITFHSIGMIPLMWYIFYILFFIYFIKLLIIWHPNYQNEKVIHVILRWTLNCIRLITTPISLALLFIYLLINIISMVGLLYDLITSYEFSSYMDHMYYHDYYDDTNLPSFLSDNVLQADSYSPEHSSSQQGSNNQDGSGGQISSNVGNRYNNYNTDEINELLDRNNRELTESNSGLSLSVLRINSHILFVDMQIGVVYEFISACTKDTLHSMSQQFLDRFNNLRFDGEFTVHGTDIEATRYKAHYTLEQINVLTNDPNFSRGDRSTASIIRSAISEDIADMDHFKNKCLSLRGDNIMLRTILASRNVN